MALFSVKMVSCKLKFLIPSKSIIIGIFLLFGYFIYDWNLLFHSLVFIYSPIYKHIGTQYNWDNEGTALKWNTIFAENTTVHTGISAQDNGKKLLINSSHCQLEHIAPMDKRFPEISRHFATKPQTPCQGRPLSILQNGVLRMNMDPEVQKQYTGNLSKCYYKPFDVSLESEYNLTFHSAIQINMDKENKIKFPWILVECISKENKTIYRNFHSQIVTREDYNGIPIQDLGKNEFNVMVVIIDSVSRLGWLRHCPEIHKFIKDELGGIMMNGHHVVGQNTVHNMHGILNGKPIGDLKSSLLARDKFIFSNFANNGFATYEAGDILGLLFLELLFGYNLRMKNKEPMHTNRAFRNLYNSTYKYIIPLNSYYDKKQCYGSTNIANQSLSQAIEFHRTYTTLGKKSMSLVQLTDGVHTHGDCNGLSRDKDLIMNFFKELKSSGVVENTLIFFGGDHGCRFDYFKSYVGRYESRLPLMYGIFPDNFKKKFPSAVKNFEFNSKHRITSQYDLYYTLKALANIGSLSDDMYSPWLHKGMNLFTRIPEERGCSGAGITSNFCACGFKKSLEPSDPRAQKAGAIFIKEVNKLVQNVDCVKYDKFDVIEAYLIQPKGDITITIHTRPIVAKLRTTMSLDKNKVMLGQIERLEHYAPVTTCMKQEQILSKDGTTYGNVCVCKSDAWKVTMKSK